LVVISSGVSWDAAKGSEHHLAWCLTQYADVLWVDAPESVVTRARFRGVEQAVARRRLTPSLVALSESFHRLRTVGPPFWSRAGVRSVTWPLVRAQIRWALRRLDREPTVVAASHSRDVLGRWGEGVVNVLYGTDDWVAGAVLMNQDPRRVLAEERAAIARADLVLTVSGELADRWRELGAAPIVFPNACDVHIYSRVAAAAPGAVPADLPTPVAGVVGQLSERIDARLLAAVADTGMGLLLVGPLEPRWARRELGDLLARPNVHHVGPVPFEEIPRWLARIDVGLTPYARSDFNRASFPLKTLEYLAAGLPVVSTDLPASRKISEQTDQLWVAADTGGFVSAIRKAAAARREPELVRARLAVAARYSWEARALQFAQLTGLHG